MLECWSCETANLPGRTFCIECGTFIGSSSALSSSAKEQIAATAALSTPSSPPAFPGAGITALGSNAVAMQRREGPGRRRLLAATLVVLAAAVGLAAIYVAVSPGGREREPLSLAGVTAATSAPTPPSTVDGLDDPSISDDTSTVSAVLETAAPIDTLDAAPADVPSREGDPLDPRPAEAAVSTQAPSGIEDTAKASPPQTVEAGIDKAETDEADVDRPDTDRADVDRPDTDRADVDRPDATPATRDRKTPVRRDGWVCDGAVRLEDPRGRDWSLGRVSFLQQPGYERVVLHLQRLGQGAGDPASVTAEAFATSRISKAVPGVRRPSSGQTTISLHLADGFEGNLGLRGYRPSGLQNLKEFSVFPAGRQASRVLVSVGDANCFRLRVPAWRASGNNVRQAQILLDIKS